jgi:hypothetical protein
MEEWSRSIMSNQVSNPNLNINNAVDSQVELEPRHLLHFGVSTTIQRPALLHSF